MAKPEDKKKPDTERASLRMESIWSDAEQRVIQDIVRRIKKNGHITSTADYQINRLIDMGKSSEEVERILKEALNATWPEMFKLYDDIAEWEYVRNKDIYEQVNREFVPPEDNKWLTQMSESVKEQTKDELTNISQSYGFAVNMNGKTVFMPYAEYYQKYVDAAIMDVISGNFDYNTVLRRVVKQMTDSGLRTVDYASGWSNRTPVAVRRAVMTGISQITGKISERNADILGTDHYEVSWHPAARPDHRVWQGKVYSYKQLETVCGLGTVTGLHGANCNHDYYPFIPGVSERMYTDEWLAEQNRKESITREWHSKQLDAYGITQQQRKMETAMRAQRSKIVALQKGGYDLDQLTLEKAKYQAQLYEYTVFSRKMGVPQQRERIYMDRLGKLATNSKKQNARYTPEMMKNANRDLKQYEKYANILQDNRLNLADFRQMKYNDTEEYNLLKKRVKTYSEIDNKSWDSNFKKSSKEAYDRFSKDDIYLSVHALSRLPRLNKPGTPEISEKELIDFIKGSPKYKDGDNKLIYFDADRQLVAVKNKSTGDIVSVVRRKNQKEVWEDV